MHSKSWPNRSHCSFTSNYLLQNIPKCQQSFWATLASKNGAMNFRKSSNQVTLVSAQICVTSLIIFNLFSGSLKLGKVISCIIMMNSTPLHFVKNKIHGQAICRGLQCNPIWIKIKILWQFCDGLFCFWQKFFLQFWRVSLVLGKIWTYFGQF